MLPNRSFWARDLPLLATLLCVSGGVRFWLVGHTEVMARDGIGYVQFAKRLERESWKVVLPSVQQHPLYPINVLLCKRLLVGEAKAHDASGWQRSAQVANAFWGTLLALPLYGVGRQLFNRRVAFWGTLCFVCLPTVARVTSDALSEGTYLFWSILALCLAIHAIHGQRLGWLAPAGVAGGLAYLARPEGALIVLVTGLGLFAFPLLRLTQPTWRWTSASLLTLGGAAALTAAPYWFAIGGLSVKPTFNRVLETTEAREQGIETIMLAARISGNDDDRADSVSAMRAVWEVLQEVGKSFFYVTWIPAVVGLCHFRKWRSASPGLLLVIVLIAANLLILWRLFLRAHYVSERHTLMIVACGSMLSAAMLLRGLPALRWPRLGAPRRWAMAALAVVIACALAQALRPLHAHRLGHKLAGTWLAGQLEPGDRIDDPYGWVTYYATQGEAHEGGAAVSGRTPKRYLVIDPTERDPARIVATGKGAKPIFSWPADADPQLVLYVADLRQ